MSDIQHQKPQQHSYRGFEFYLQTLNIKLKSWRKRFDVSGSYPAKQACPFMISNNYCGCLGGGAYAYCNTNRVTSRVTSHLKPRNSRPALDYSHFDSSRNAPSLTNILTAIEVIDRVPGEWWRDGAIALYSTVSGVDRRHVDRIRGIQAAIAGGVA